VPRLAKPARHTRYAPGRVCMPRRLRRPQRRHARVLCRPETCVSGRC